MHSVGHVLEDPGIHPDTRWTLLLDFSNAFNTVSCEVLCREVRAHLPSMLAWIECCYTPQPLSSPWAPVPFIVAVKSSRETL